ncbi:PAS domain-containing protein [Streptosporangium sp. NBC_01755]|uniref:CheR family methyltransferase n=1 Tax=unclassified Streptosporangium TaxID=2632669 RepID=UPI002DDC0E67|nr:MULTISPECIES: CheR family methyltransferase [unclassified Streptosporangium]WSA23416.1 PAS domain-containing protein [Streptosporangium sp. NBC_01810]WSD04178.1 PAS domain-containing protein [Streptosporangium sp. NBC_01755]
MPGDEREFDDLLLMLKETRGFDFTGYKRTTLMRRISRRLGALKLRDYGEYRDYLELEPEEFGRLFDSLLINVTAFFRDPPAWQTLRESVIPSLLESKGPGKVIRIWSAGCATGEEAYSLAMLLAEELGMDAFRERVKIYATDLDQKALQTARAAVYSERRLSELPDGLRQKYFEPADAGFAFRRDLRRQLIFGRNDLTRDAPISRVDLMLARNTLMYFNSETQLSIVRRFHFALSDPGYLFLGKAEMLLNHGDRFEPVNLRMRLFKKIGSPPPGNRVTWAPGTGVSQSHPYVRHTVLQAAALATGPVAQIALDRSRNLALANSRAELLFNLNPRDIGRPFQDLEISYRPVELRSVIDQVEQDLRVAELQDVTWRRPDAPEASVFDIAVVPLVEPGGELVGVGVNFHDVTRYRRLRDRLEQTNRELEHAYEELQSTNEELETTNEELQSTNEELETTNEELQSTNEELETMNEELQSTNDELQQINDTLNSCSDELKRATDLVSSVVRSLGDAVAVVDTDLRVLVWSPGAEELWGLRTDEALGCRLASLDIGLPVGEILAQVQRMLDAEPGPGNDRGDSVTLDGVNRRGRPTRLRVDLSRLHTDDMSPDGVIMVMNLLH